MVDTHHSRFVIISLRLVSLSNSCRPLGKNIGDIADASFAVALYEEANYFELLANRIFTD